MSLGIDPKLLKALEEAGRKMMEEARARGDYIPTPPSSFATGGYVNGWEIIDEITDDPIRGQHADFIDSFQAWVDDSLLQGETIIDMGDYDPEPFYYIDQDSGKYNIITDLTTAQKMRSFKFIIAIETAEEL